MLKRLLVCTLIAGCVATAIVYFKYGPGTPVTREISLKLESVPPADGARQTFYIVALTDASGKRLVTAEQLVQGATRLEGAKLANNGHGLWADLPAFGSQFFLEWKGKLPLKRGEELFALAGKSVQGSILDISLGVSKSRIDLNTVKGENSIKFSLGIVNDIGIERRLILWLAYSLALATLFVGIVFCEGKFKAFAFKHRWYSGEQHVELGTDHRQRLFSVSVCCCSLFVLPSFFVYVANWGVIDVSSKTLFTVNTVVFLLFFAVAFGVSFVPYVSRYAYPLVQVFGIVFFVLLFFPNKTGEIAGFSNYLTEQRSALSVVKITSITCLIVLLRIFRLRDFLWFHKFVGVLAILTTLGLGGYIAYKDNHTWAPKHIKTGADSELLPVYLGNERNVVVLVLDATTGSSAARVLEKNEALRDKFRGFTIYPNAISSALNTPAGLTAILTGDIGLVIEEEQGSQRNEKMIKKSFLASAHEAGAKTYYISQNLPARSFANVANEQKYFIKRENTYGETLIAATFWANSTIRILPPIVTQIALKAVNFLRQNNKMDKDLWNYYYSRNTESERAPIASSFALKQLINSISVAQHSSSILFFHSKLTHPPASFSAAGNYALGEGDAQDGTVAYGLELAADLKQKIQELGVLDQTLFMVVSDHGGTGGGMNSFSIYNPLILFNKGSETDTLTVDRMTVWLGDIYATVMNYMTLESSRLLDANVHPLLGDSDVNRELELPLFVRPNHLSYHSALSKWTKIVCRGNYSNFVAQITIDLETLLKKDCNIELYAGVDTFAEELRQSKYIESHEIQRYCGITISGFPMGRQNQQGLIILQPGQPIKTFTSLREQEHAIASASRTENIIIIGLQVNPKALISNDLFASALSPDMDAPVNLIYASSSSIPAGPIKMVGTNDLSTTIHWVPQK